MNHLLRKNYLGIDVSKLWFDVSLLPIIDHVKQPIITERFDNTTSGMTAFKAWLKSTGVTLDQHSLLVIENTGVYHRLLWGFCSKYNLPLYIGNAAHIKWSLGITRGKSDVIDSVRLCQYCYKQSDELKATPALNPVFMKLKDLMTSRSRLVTQLHSTKNYIKELQCSNDKVLQAILEKAHQAAIEGIKKSIIQIEVLIEQIIKDDTAIYKNYLLIKSVPGIGHLTALYIICCTNNFASKVTGKQLASYAGVVPFEHSSGTSIKGRNRVHKMANKDLKKMLHLCALTAIKYYPEFRQYFDRKKAEGKNGMLVLNAIRNKIILRAVAVVNKRQPYVNNLNMAA
ncbi:IS110 family transposase [Parasediminibacterium paludis]|uniref:IS110 family transposase n=1 Tax=Parasediminibacterium paludis TaxID=908966 RepID=A0ABV8PX86_9BACT